MKFGWRGGGACLIYLKSYLAAALLPYYVRSIVACPSLTLPLCVRLYGTLGYHQWNGMWNWFALTLVKAE